MNNTIKVIAAVSAGIAVGTLVGILIAPDKGTETIKTIKKEGIKIAEEIKDNLIKGKEKFENIQEEMAQSLADRYKEFA